MGACAAATESGTNSACPGFEGFEKRLELHFCATRSNSAADGRGLRALSRADIEQMLTAAQCTIVSELSNEYCDSYVLSESSLFVYPLKIVLKTCGTTQLLRAIPSLLASSSQLHLKVSRCKYTRGTFMFPSVQPYPHGNFHEEVRYLEKYFGCLAAGSKAYVMGNLAKFQSWHIYMAAEEQPYFAHLSNEPTYTLEVCMTELDRSKASKFFNEDGSLSGPDMTKAAGINELIPNGKICDFAFDPCGYSMNALEGPVHSTIHVTPEDGFSYASFEVMGYKPEEENLQVLVEKVASVFKPAKFSLTVQVSAGHDGGKSSPSWGSTINPAGYVCDGTSQQDMPCGSVVVFHTFHSAAADSLLISSVKSVVRFPGGESVQEEICSLTSKKPSEVKNESQILSDSLGLCSRQGREILKVFSSVNPVAIGPTPKDVDQFILKTVVATCSEDPFYVMDLGLVLRLWPAWGSAMPRVKLFYAVKCNPDAKLLSLLAKAGSGFDVASKAEIAAVRQAGVSSDRVIFANPCKLPSIIVYAAKQTVLKTTFDSETELHKLRKFHPEAELVLRIRAADIGARCRPAVKYGAHLEECEHLLRSANEHGFTVVGVAFHVGSGATDPASFAEGIASARQVFYIAAGLGFPAFRLLDIGGGFASDGGAGMRFSSAAAAINEALDKYFPQSMAVEVIAESGRYFAEEAITVATNVFGRRIRTKDGTTTADYWVNDMIYGSFNCLVDDHAILSVRSIDISAFALEEERRHENPWVEAAAECKSTDSVFGATCDGLDPVMGNIWLTRLHCGYWLVFPRMGMGAYTKCAGSCFSGFDSQDVGTLYVYSWEDNNKVALYDSDAESDCGRITREDCFEGSYCSSIEDSSTISSRR